MGFVKIHASLFSAPFAEFLYRSPDKSGDWGAVALLGHFLEHGHLPIAQKRHDAMGIFFRLCHIEMKVQECSYIGKLKVEVLSF
jgi:hypothetical protein